MNCDQVFDILTRGPFPTGTHCDIGVEAHLDVCPQCRRLAEALRPAIELFQEAVAPEESRDLPGYWCAVAADRQQPVVSYASDPAPQRAPRRAWSAPAMVQQWSALTVWRMAAMLALGVTLGSLLTSRMSLDGGARLPATVGAPAAPNDEPSTGLSRFVGIHRYPRDTTFQLPAACFEPEFSPGPKLTVRGQQMLAKADVELLKSCSLCHQLGPHE